MTKPNLIINPYREPEPGFDEEWKPSEVFLALRLECKHLLIQGDRFYFCTHPNNDHSYVEWEHCNHDGCPLLKGLK